MAGAVQAQDRVPFRALRAALRGWAARKAADPAFQAWAVRFPPTRLIANRRAARLFDLVAGFVHSQVLLACVELDLFRRLSAGPRTASALAAEAGLSEPAMARLAHAAAALDLLRPEGDGYALGPLGAALLGAPGVEEMVRHHPMLYRDLEDPVALLRAPRGETELARFWSYVSGADPAAPEAGAYSRLMAASQAMVAAETLAVAPLADVRVLMDVGGGEGAFAEAALARHPGLHAQVVDLPEVAARAATRLAASPFADRARAIGGSFRDPLPDGADAISLVRVLYDHDDATVRMILAGALAALPPGGRLILSEPMSGGRRPTRSGDVYFALYTAAMTSGTPRAPARHKELLREAGFAQPRLLRARQPFVTRVIVANRPG